MKPQSTDWKNDILPNHCFIIAEMSANHVGDIEIAKETVRAAKRAGADAIKLQTYTADTITFNSQKDYFKIDQGTVWDGQFLYDLYKGASLPWSWHHELFRVAKEEDIICFSSPFDYTAVDFLEELNCPIYKVASFEITDIPLIKYIASKKKPVIISTGIASIEDIELAIETCRKEGNNDVAILKCTSEYPAKPEDANLLTIPDMIERFMVKVGLSDHTLGLSAPVVAVTLGATIVEKHFMLNKNLKSPDAHFSLDEGEFREMVKSIRHVEQLLGKVDYELTQKKLKNKEFSKSLFVIKDVKKGDSVSLDNIKSIRPGYGLHPKHLETILGMRFVIDVEKGEPLSFKMAE